MEHECQHGPYDIKITTLKSHEIIKNLLYIFRSFLGTTIEQLDVSGLNRQSYWPMPMP